jgi:hypothetical protein
MGEGKFDCCYDPETKQHTLQWKSPHSLRAKKKKMIGECWFPGLILKTCFNEKISKVAWSTIKLQLLSSEGLNSYDRGIIEVLS